MELTGAISVASAAEIEALMGRRVQDTDNGFVGVVNAFTYYGKRQMPMMRINGLNALGNPASWWQNLDRLQLLDA